MEFIQYEVIDHVGVITLDRAEKANAQHRPLLIELDDCWKRAVDDDDVHVILLQANGKHFSAGHDLADRKAYWGDDEEEHHLAQQYAIEARYYFDFSMGWRNAPKPSIAAVQGKCIAAGLMLAWPCDLIIAADNAQFSDPTARMGLAGVEYMAHTWELGPRKAKEVLFRSRALDAEEALQLGMVNKVVPLDELRQEAMEWAVDIASLDPIMTRMLKRGINATVDAQGFTQSLQHSFDIHELAHGIQESMARLDSSVRSDNVLEHMRKTNAAIATDQATEKAS